jgi:DNA sulfur modification protein DndC
LTNSYFNENTIEDLLEEIEYVYLSDNRPWIIGYSGGKDSTVVVHLVYEMLKRLSPAKRTKRIYVVSSDTMVENPLIKEYLSDMVMSISKAARNDMLPITSQIVYPEPNNTFWANVIGRGFPTPRLNGTFRWCTDRLKIVPSANYIIR